MHVLRKKKKKEKKTRKHRRVKKKNTILHRATKQRKKERKKKLTEKKRRKETKNTERNWVKQKSFIIFVFLLYFPLLTNFATKEELLWGAGFPVLLSVPVEIALKIPPVTKEKKRKEKKKKKRIKIFSDVREQKI